MSGHADTIKQIRHSTCGVFRERDTDTWYDALTAAEAVLREVEALRAELASLREQMGDARMLANYLVTFGRAPLWQTTMDAARRILAPPAPAPTCPPRWRDDPEQFEALVRVVRGSVRTEAADWIEGLMRADVAMAAPTCATCDGTGRWCGTDCRDVRCSPCAPCPSCTPAPTCATCGGVGRVNEITPGLPSVPCPACKARP